MPYRQEESDDDKKEPDPADAWRGAAFQRLSEQDKAELRKAFPAPNSGEGARQRYIDRIGKREDAAEVGGSSEDARQRMLARLRANGRQAA